MKLYQKMAQLVVARLNCIKSNSGEWQDKHEDAIERLVKEHMPSGSGFDNGTHISLDDCGDNCLVFTTSFHHMNDNGMYVGWTEHSVHVTPSFDGFNLRVTGRDRNGIKDYIGEAFHMALMTEVQ